MHTDSLTHSVPFLPPPSICPSSPRLPQGNQAFAECVRRIEQLPDIERLTFRDFVAKPMQRLTKYPLLIEVSCVRACVCEREGGGV